MKIVKNNKDHAIYIVIKEDVIEVGNEIIEDCLMILYMDLTGILYVREQQEFWNKFHPVDPSDIECISREKSIRDMVKPEVLKKAKEFTEMIKDGTIKNRHTSMYDNESMRKILEHPDSLNQKLDRDKIEKYAARERENNSLKESILNLYKTVSGKQDVNYKDTLTEFTQDIDKEFIEALNEMKGTEKSSKERFTTTNENLENKFPGFGKVFAEVNKAWDKDNKSINQQCYLTYLYLKGWYDRNVDEDNKQRGIRMEEGLMGGIIMENKIKDVQIKIKKN